MSQGRRVTSYKKKAKNGSGFTPKKMAGVLGQNGFDGP